MGVIKILTKTKDKTEVIIIAISMSIAISVSTCGLHKIPSNICSGLYFCRYLSSKRLVCGTFFFKFY